MHVQFPPKNVLLLTSLQLASKMNFRQPTTRHPAVHPGYFTSPALAPAPALSPGRAPDSSPNSIFASLPAPTRSPVAVSHRVGHHPSVSSPHTRRLRFELRMEMMTFVPFGIGTDVAHGMLQWGEDGVPRCAVGVASASVQRVDKVGAREAHTQFIMFVGGCRRSVSRTTVSRNGRPTRTSYGRLTHFQSSAVSAPAPSCTSLARRKSLRSRDCASGSSARMWSIRESADVVVSWPPRRNVLYTRGSEQR